MVNSDLNFVLGFQNEYIINELEINCKVNENEFNLSQNPTIVEDNFGSLKSYTSSSFFTPYVTTVGLYNEVNELLAVAKLSQPIKLSNVTDTVFVVRLDL